MSGTSFRAHVMAVDRVEKRLHRVTAALERARIPYAVIGGNAVAAWVARADPSAARATRDVDLLVRRDDLDEITKVMQDIGFQRQDLRGFTLFIDPEEPSRRSGVHLVWAGVRVRPSYTCAAPSVDEAVRDPAGFFVLNLAALVRMKLTSYRDIDRVHVADLMSVDLIDESVRRALPTELLARLDSIAGAMDE